MGLESCFTCGHEQDDITMIYKYDHYFCTRECFAAFYTSVNVRGANIEFNESETHLQWRYVTDTEWIDLIPLTDLQGEQGEQGEQGPAGQDSTVPGPKGDTGDPGQQGEQGEAGPAGYTPIKGVDYFDGAPGEKGDTGSKGDTGETGPKGDKGDAGADGAQGPQGIQGEQGPQGYTGEQGLKGDDGDPGPAGEKGDKGDPGDQGIQGIQGEVGPAGADGAQGIQGIQGPSGPASIMVVPIHADAANSTWSNMPAAAAFWQGSHRHVSKHDLTNFTQARLVVNKQGTAGNAGSKLILKYRTAFSTTVGDYLDIGDSEISVAVSVQNSVLVSEWVNLAAGAKADVFVCLVGSGGNGVIDPIFGTISAQFK